MQTDYLKYDLKRSQRLEALKLIMDDPCNSREVKGKAIQETKKEMEKDLDAIFKILLAC